MPVRAELRPHRKGVAMHRASDEAVFDGQFPRAAVSACASDWSTCCSSWWRDFTPSLPNALHVVVDGAGADECGRCAAGRPRRAGGARGAAIRPYKTCARASSTRMRVRASRSIASRYSVSAAHKRAAAPRTTGATRTPWANACATLAGCLVLIFAPLLTRILALKSTMSRSMVIACASASAANLSSSLNRSRS